MSTYVRTLRQLLRELWLPVVVGTLWTLYNVADKPPAEWELRTLVNVFGPTFFFASWLGSQWYRVRKQQRVEASVDAIQAGVEALHSPLLPAVAFLSLRFEAGDDDLRRIFEGQRGYKEFENKDGGQVSGPGLPPGVSSGRVHFRNGFLDYEEGKIVAAGAYRHGFPRYNIFQREVRHTRCELEPHSAPMSRSGTEALFFAPFVTVQLYFSGSLTRGNARPDLTLRGQPTDSSTPVGAFAIDNTVIVDHSIPLRAAEPIDKKGYSPSRLRGAYVRVLLDFFFIEGLLSLPRSVWPLLHNFQIVFAASSQLLAFSLEDLDAQVVRENPEPLAGGSAVMPQVLFEFELSPEKFDKRLVQFG